MIFSGIAKVKEKIRLAKLGKKLPAKKHKGGRHLGQNKKEEKK